MASGDKNNQAIKKVLKSFSYATTGILETIKQERNMKIHLFCAVLVITISFLLSISSYEWLIILIVIGSVISLELINSAIERAIDLVTNEYKPLAKQAKDAAAGAVLFFVIIAVIVGLIIFLPKIITLFIM